VPAAGEGTRLGGERKQLRELGGRPLLVQTLQAFESHPEIQHIIVAVPGELTSPVLAMLRASGLTKLSAVVPGGSTRQASVRAALQATPHSVEVVLVHDAVRPFLSAPRISAVIDAARVDGAAALAIPVSDTVRRGAGDRFGETVSRHDLYRMQTPQAFRHAILAAAHEEAFRSGRDATDDVDLVQQLGEPVRIVEGSPLNIKITTPLDWELAEILWPGWAKMNDRST
jgi:2-C-methyl-D-erythritol 4-phosphate cytidylyltransferase